MSFQVALSFEDGVTRFITVNPFETVADASYKARINIPLDCRDGACGTCKSFCESGTFDPGDFIDDAMTEDELEKGYLPTCQSTPESDMSINIPSTSEVAKTSAVTFNGKVDMIERHSDSTISFIRRRKKGEMPLASARASTSSCLLKSSRTNQRRRWVARDTSAQRALSGR